MGKPSLLFTRQLCGNLPIPNYVQTGVDPSPCQLSPHHSRSCGTTDSLLAMITSSPSLFLHASVPSSPLSYPYLPHLIYNGTNRQTYHDHMQPSFVQTRLRVLLQPHPVLPQPVQRVLELGPQWFQQKTQRQPLSTLLLNSG
jgi:hypothetical protein